MARMVRADPRGHAPEPAPLADTSVEWSAKLVQPRRYHPGSQQPLIVQVQAPVVLDAQHVAVDVDGRSAAAQWIGDPGQHRQATVTLGRDLHTAGGKVTVRVEGVVLPAGLIRTAR